MGQPIGTAALSSVGLREAQLRTYSNNAPGSAAGWYMLASHSADMFAGSYARLYVWAKRQKRRVTARGKSRGYNGL
ncbi:protein of unknown function [Methylocaldum szegediense]|uniref:Uncharacterized protein n=1 Tax=Methylocaldum szegediense TaxID=73780 RepID=A0ABM9I7U7_9GAMM|nr:protein of unknown function [Methylocaldum szegediense]